MAAGEILRQLSLLGENDNNEEPNPENRYFINNKFSQLFLLTSLVDYPAVWPTFFHDLLAALNLNNISRISHQVVNMYLRILLMLHEEVVDRDIPHTDMELRRNGLFKDCMREQCVTDLVSSWFDILVLYESLLSTSPSISSTILASCLQTIGSFVSWIDINLIANDRFIEIILRLMGCNKVVGSSQLVVPPIVRGAACSCLSEVISKGMDSVMKLKLVESMVVILETSGVIRDVVDLLDKNENTKKALVKSEDDDGDDEEEEDDDDEYLEKFAHLMANFGQQLVLCWQKFVKNKDLENAKIALDALQPKLGLLLKLFGNDDDDVSRTTINFLTDYIGLLKMLPSSSEVSSFVEQVLCVLLKKMRYMKGYNFNHEGEEECDFQEYRKELKIVFVNLSSLDCDVLLKYVASNFNVVMSSLQQTTSFEDVEVAIYSLFLLVEVMPTSNTGGRTSKVPEQRINILYEMIKTLIISQVSHYPHPAVQSQFFETIARYDRFFSAFPQYIHRVLEAFLDERGIWSAHCHIRSRTAYLFSRFVKSINKAHLQDSLEMILTRLESLLVLNTSLPPLPPPHLSSSSSQHKTSHHHHNSSHNHHPHPTSSTSTFHHGGMMKHNFDANNMCNSAAVKMNNGGGVGTSNAAAVDNSNLQLSTDDQQFMFETASVLIVQSSFAPERKRELLNRLVVPILLQFEELLAQMTSERDESLQVFYAQLLNRAMSFISRTSKGFSGQQTVHGNGCISTYTGAMQVFIKVLQVPIQTHLLHQGFRQFLHRMVICMDTDILQFIPTSVEGLMLNASIKQLHEFIPFLNQLIQKFKKTIVPYMQKVFIPIISLIQKSLTSAAVDEEDQVIQMEKKMLQRGYYGYINVIINNDTAEILSNQEPNDLNIILTTIIQGAANCSDPTAQKTCFAILKRMIEIWGGTNIVPNLREFVYKEIVPCCFQVPLSNEFDVVDAQTILVLNEIAGCLGKAHRTIGPELINYVTFTYLPSLNFNNQVIQEFCQNLAQSNDKIFQNYLKSFVLQVRQAES
ncbi:hypothetical protein HELRODRAFT_192301 [Helobdella robusta]|uniref:Exportin-T n=1 Tax=Helobdella robusta TaxID=6412 RepID=T1FTT1_HELRO|nr:hypothetical protein HELRODRAFT_192301 [Helobdella robusta]ESO01347.1 hypothetical protein HELRODRAFT_192301 [Helobdella robusta]